ncbi:MAG: DUF1638 domain-containing protein, partial [Spirochaetales bacterium]|nr:DUF1638 domain-containing protein [Spirochaetales bacterium]
MEQKRIHLIACGVLRVDMDAVQKELGINFNTTWLEGGLHSKPAELRRRLQAAIDAVEDADLIAVGYGICGRGTVDLHARSIPLAIPRVHDCISLFLGSDEAYSREFAGCPGTYYISAGWYEEKIQPKQGADHVDADPESRKENPSYQYLVDKYGTDNAEEITEFLSSWQRNYQRSVFIDTGNKKKANYEKYAKDMAEEFGWEYKKIDGDLSLLKALLNPEDPETILTVPSGYVTAFDPLSRKLTAHPEAENGELFGFGKGNRQTTDSQVPADPARRERLGLGIDAGGTYTDVAIFSFSDRAVLETAKALTTKWDYTVGINEALDSLAGDWYERIDIVAISTTLATNAIVEGTGQHTGLILMPPAGLGEEDFSVPTVVVPGKMNISGSENEPVDIQRVKEAARVMRDRLDVKAFAVSGYAGSVNPAHELAVKEAL